MKLDPAGVSRLLTTERVGRRLVVLDQVESTNDVALAMAEGTEDGLVVVAEEQTRGRGRSGGEWLAPVGTALLFSVLVRFRQPVTLTTRLTIGAAVAVCGALRAVGVDGHIKWPNDVLVGERKLCGILCESRARGAWSDCQVIGIGINVSQSPDELPAGAISACLARGEAVAREPLLAAVLNRLEREVARVHTGRFESVADDWEELAPRHRRGAVRVDGPLGSFIGTSIGLDRRDGALLVDTNGHIERVISASIALL